MYKVIQKINGKFLGRAMIQDGFEDQEFETEKEAIKHCKQVAKICNGNPGLKKKDIEFFIEKHVVTSVIEKR